MPNDAEAYRLLIADLDELAGLSRRSSERLASRHGQTVARWQTMSVVAAEDMTVPEIASRLGHARQSVQRVVDDLVREGLLVRRPNPRHRRSPLVALTTPGRHLLGRLDSEAEDERTTLLASGGVQRRELLAARRTVRSLLALLRARER